MTLVERTGDMFATDLTSLGQGVNVKGLMGAGIAVAFRNRFPLMHEDYQGICERDVLRPGGLHHFVEDGFSIYNIASQKFPGKDATLARLRRGTALALAKVVEREEEGLALPRIGCGIGGLDWDDVRPILGELADEYDTLLEVWTL